MKTQDIIKTKRIAKGLTQREVAEALGISATAVNKWEQGKTYPDITLLSPLARLLETDLNQLLGFHENLSDHEIGERLNQLAETFHAEGVEVAFKLAQDMIQTYPNSDSLIFNIAELLEGLVMMDGAANHDENYQQEINLLYQRVSTTTDESLRFKVATQRFHLFLEQEDFAAAESVLGDVPINVPDITFLSALLAKKQKKYFQSSQSLESNLLLLLNNIHQHLSLLTANALAEKNNLLAHEYAKAAGELAKTFQLWEYNQYTLPLDLAIAEKNQAETIRLLQELLKASEKPWKLSETTLYPHLPTKEQAHDSEFFRTMLTESFLDTPELEYVQGNQDFRALFE